MKTISKKEISDTRLASEDQAVLSSAEEIIAEARAGSMFILVDDEDRENEGDLIIPAQTATAEAVNFMAREGRGLICLAMDGTIIDRLGLDLMEKRNEARHGTAFTVSIEAKEGVTTGISAADRAHTIKVAIDPQSGPSDIATPGHVFPLRAREGGVLVRAGHTEAAVDISKMAGMEPAGVICEIMNDDGTMARLPDLVGFARRHNLKIGTIADLIAHRRTNERLVDKIHEGEITSRYGGTFKLCLYANTVQYMEHIALVKGDISDSDEPVLVRMHALNLVQDVLGEGDAVLEKSMKKIDEAGRGILVLIREPNARSLSARLNRDRKITKELRDYGVGAQILTDLGVKKMVLLSNTDKTVVGLDGYGLEIVGRQSLDQE